MYFYVSFATHQKPFKTKILLNGLDGVIIKVPKSESGIRDIHVVKEVIGYYWHYFYQKSKQTIRY